MQKYEGLSSLPLSSKKINKKEYIPIFWSVFGNHQAELVGSQNVLPGPLLNRFAKAAVFSPSSTVFEEVHRIIWMLLVACFVYSTVFIIFTDDVM